MFRHDPTAMMAAAGALLCAAMIAQATAAYPPTLRNDRPPAVATPLPAEKPR